MVHKEVVASFQATWDEKNSLHGTNYLRVCDHSQKSLGICVRLQSVGKLICICPIIIFPYHRKMDNL